MQFHISHYQTVTSTMDVARELANRGAPEGTTVVADQQTAGRGRASHTWYSPPGQSLYVSVVLRPVPALAPNQIGWITMIAALAVMQACRGALARVQGSRGEGALRSADSPLLPCTPAPTLPGTLAPMLSIKWFNDVLLNGRKLCGILLEASFTGDQLDYGVLGIGLNVNTRFDDAPADVRARATSLLNECVNEWNESVGLFDRADVLQRVLAHFGERYETLLRTRQSPAQAYAQHVETLGREVRIDTGNEIVAGRALRIDPDGALIVQTPSGERRIRIGDVISARR